MRRVIASPPELLSGNTIVLGEMAGTTDPPQTVESVERAFKVIDALRDRDGAGVTELSNELDMSKGGIYKQLTTLVEAGYVIRNDGEYSLGYKFVYEGEHVKRNSSFYKAGVPQLEELARKCGDFAYLVAVGRNGIYCIYTAKGENSTASNVQVGDRIPPHSSAAGKAVLSKLSKERQSQLLREETQNEASTTTEKEIDKSELKSVRERGVAFEDGECVRGLRSVASSVTSQSNEVLGSVAVSGPHSLLVDKRFKNELPEIVQQTTNIIEMHLSLESQSRLQDGSHVPSGLY